MALEATVIAAIRHLYIYGASKQNRTVIICLEGRGFAIKLYLHRTPKATYIINPDASVATFNNAFTFYY